MNPKVKSLKLRFCGFVVLWFVVLSGIDDSTAKPPICLRKIDCKVSYLDKSEGPNLTLALSRWRKLS
jgi:hypothetical protein